MYPPLKAGQKARSPAPFDTELLQQIIDIEIEECVRALRSQGIAVEGEIQHRWNVSLNEILTHVVIEESSSHCLMPQEFQEELNQMLQNLIEDDFGSQMESQHTEIALKSSRSLFARLRHFWHRLMWKKAL